MIRRLAALVAVAATLALATMSASAATTHDVRGTWDFSCNICGAQTHTFETQDASGKLTGHGSAGATTWSITGNVTGDTINFTLKYDGSSYQATMTGTINADTTAISGTFDDTNGHSAIPYTMSRASGSQPLPPVAGPDPVVGRTVNIAAVKPGVKVKVPGAKGFEPLTDARQVQVGSIIDANKGTVRMSIANGNGSVNTADFYEGAFKVTQLTTGTKFATMTLVGGNFKGCPRAPKAQLSGKGKTRSVRHLWGSGMGSFRTAGRFSAASVRGTKWLTDDKCNATLTRVKQGAVSVRDFVRKKTVVVKAPGHYLASAR